MELLGLLFAAPVTMGASAVYTALARWAFGRWPWVEKVALPLSYTIAALAGVELLLLVFLGAKGAFFHLHHAYTTLHFIVFLCAPPAVANVVLHFTAKKDKRKRMGGFGAAVVCCWFACMTALLGNIMIDEAIMGVDAGKPFYMTKKADPVGTDNSWASPLRV